MHNGIDKHLQILQLAGLHLESVPLGSKVSALDIAKDKHLDHRAVRRALLHAYHSQVFMPRIQPLFTRSGKVKFLVEDLPNYVKECSFPEEAILLRLFSRNAIYGKKTSLVLAPNEASLIPKIGDLVVYDSDYKSMGLTRRGAELAFKRLEQLTRIRDVAFSNMKSAAMRIARLRSVIRAPAVIAEEREKELEDICQEFQLLIRNH